MDTKFQSSFIPKQPVNEPARSSSGSNIFFLISFLIFIIACVGAGTVYFWDKQMDNKITSVNNNLNSLRSSFDQNTIKDFTNLNNKINAANYLLRQHIAPSVLFSIIGDTTLKNVRFTSFKYSNAGGDKISISMAGEAKSYESVVLQSSAFLNPKLRNVFRNTIFSDPDLNANGKAVFSFTTGVDPILLNYYKLKADPKSQFKLNNIIPATESLNTSSDTTNNTDRTTGTQAQGDVTGTDNPSSDLIIQ